MTKLYHITKSKLITLMNQNSDLHSEFKEHYGKDIEKYLEERSDTHNLLSSIVKNLQLESHFQKKESISKTKYTIYKKINYKTENLHTQQKVDQAISIIKEQMQSNGFKFCENKHDKDIKYIFSVGGDGTMMHTIGENVDSNKVIIGVNGGNVGFLTPYSISDLDSNIWNDLKNPRIEQRSLIQYELFKNNNLEKKGVAVNEYAITADGPNDVLSFSIEIEYKGKISKAGHYKANALVISGPLGSTAYNMNIGGAIVDPNVSCLQIAMVAPITMGTRPIIIGKNSKIHVFFHKKARIHTDGILQEIIKPDDDKKLTITLLPKEVNLLLPQNWNFYSSLSEKLHWNNGEKPS